MSGGLPWAKIATDLTADPKVQRLARKYPEAEYLEALGAWLLVVLESWRTGTREVDDQDLPPGPLGRLQAVRLLDADGRIPADSWEKWGARAIREVQERDDQHREISRLGGRARASQAVRDERGRIQPGSSGRQVDVQPTAGGDPAAHQPDPAKREMERERETERRERSRSGNGSRGTIPREVTLTKAQYQAWQTYPGPLWATVREAWLAKGLRTPPPGPTPENAPDDPDKDTTPRGRLWRIMDGDPGMAAMVARWIHDAPTTKAGDVLQYVFTQAEARRASLLQAAARADAEEARKAQERSRPGGGAESLGSILGRVQGAQ